MMITNARCNYLAIAPLCLMFAAGVGGCAREAPESQYQVFTGSTSGGTPMPMAAAPALSATPNSCTDRKRFAA